jgi:hypothetical protein
MTEKRIKELNLLIFHAVDRNGDGIEKTLATLREAGITYSSELIRPQVDNLSTCL